MPFPKKKKKSRSPQLEYLQKQREREWDDVMKRGRKSYPTTEENFKQRKELKRLEKKYGIKKD
jgi:hypothetical protein